MCRSGFAVRSKLLLLLLICADILSFQCSSFIQNQRVLLRSLQVEIPSIESCRRLPPTCLKCFSSDSDMTGGGEKRLKVLCLHGYLSSSKYFRLQLRRLVDEAADISDFEFLDGPHRFGLLKQQLQQKTEIALPTATGEIGGNAKVSMASAAGKFRWWYASESRGGEEGYEEAVQYQGLQESLIAIAKTEREQGPFDVVLGHSQGACLVVAMDCLRSRPDFLSTLLNAGDIDSEEETEADTTKLNLPDAALSIVIGGFVPRDQIFDTLFSSIEKDATMNGLPQKSLHLFSHEDSIVPPEASMQAMYLYENPRMMIRNGDHDPDDQTVDQVLKALKNMWTKKYTPPLLLEG